MITPRVRGHRVECGCKSGEVLVSTNLVVISGEIRSNADIDYEAIARETVREIGYDGFDPNFGCDTCEVLVRVAGCGICSTAFVAVSKINSRAT